MKLDKEEKEILEAYEKGEFSPIPYSRKKSAEYKKHSVQTLQKNKRINIGKRSFTFKKESRRGDIWRGCRSYWGFEKNLAC
jgi:hypothetical protein